METKWYEHEVLWMPWPIAVAFIIGVPVAIYAMAWYRRKKKKDGQS